MNDNKKIGIILFFVVILVFGLLFVTGIFAEIKNNVHNQYECETKQATQLCEHYNSTYSFRTGADKVYCVTEYYEEVSYYAVFNCR